LQKKRGECVLTARVHRIVEEKEPKTFHSKDDARIEGEPPESKKKVEQKKKLAQKGKEK